MWYFLLFSEKYENNMNFRFSKHKKQLILINHGSFLVKWCRKKFFFIIQKKCISELNVIKICASQFSGTLNLGSNFIPLQLVFTG